MNKDQPLTMTTSEAAKYHGLTTIYVAKLYHKGALTGRQTSNGQILLDTESVHNLKRNKVGRPVKERK